MTVHAIYHIIVSFSSKGLYEMATWVTHLIVADKILEGFPWLDKRGFCVGNIAPDCNVENSDWTSFTPPRAVPIGCAAIGNRCLIVIVFVKNILLIANLR